MTYIEWSDEQLEELNIDKKDLEILVRHLERVSKKLDSMSLNLYVGMGSVKILHNSKPSHVGKFQSPTPENVIASVYMNADGGDW